MKIALFTETFLPATDGVVTRLRHTLDELSRFGDEVCIIAPRYPEGGPDSYNGYKIHRVPGLPFPPYPQIKMAPTNPTVGRVLQRFGPDLIHAVNPFILGMWTPYYARRFRLPLIASYHTNVAAYTRFYGLGFLYEAARWYVRTIHNKARLNLCTSSATREYLYSEGIKHIRLWPQGVDSDRFHPDKRSAAWRAKLSGGHPDAPLLIFVGRIAPEKGIERLKTVLKELPEARLAIVGEGPAKKHLERDFAGMPAIFTGKLSGEDLAAAYSSADVFLFPSTTDTLGMAMLEALASGLPVVAARAGAGDEVVTEGESGLLYDPDSIESFVGAVRRIVGDEGLRKHLSQGARIAAKGRNWSASTQTLRSYYDETLSLTSPQ